MLDSGEREEFESGMIREPNMNRGRFDLISPVAICAFIKYSSVSFDDRSFSIFIDELAKHHEKALIKYPERNWEKGGKLSRHMNSAIRHSMLVLRGDKKENHKTSCAWNLFCVVHHIILETEGINDLVFFDSPEKFSFSTGCDTSIIFCIYEFLKSKDLGMIFKALEFCMNSISGEHSDS